MTFYKVPTNMDQKAIYKNNRFNMQLVKDELFTAKECEKEKIDCSLLEKVEIKRTKTGWIFGARFEM